MHLPFSPLPCAHCGRAPHDERLVDEHCLRCRAVGLIDDLGEALAGHSRRVTMLATLVAGHLRLAPRVRREVELGGLLHDLGKVAVPEPILEKAGPLTTAERDVMRSHVTVGAEMAAEIEGLPEGICLVIRASHERWDGGGYPDGLRGEQIPVAARIVCCADALDAMTSSRSYRAAMPMDFALEILRAEAGRQFEPGVVEALCHVAEEWQPELAAEPVATRFEETLRRLQRESRFARPSIAPQEA